MPVNLYGLDRAQLTSWLDSFDVPRFHGAQIYRWIHARRSFDPEAWTDLPKPLRSRIASEAVIDPGTITARIKSPDRSIKYRIGFADGKSVECVLMEQTGRVTLCVSSQVGCALGCRFCLTGKMGLDRHLSAGEIVGQVARIQEDRDLTDRFNVVFMGMGEPLHNYDGVTNAIRLLTDPDGFGLSRKRITVSTVGMVPAIERLVREGILPRLAVSLNATTDEQRSRLMPVNRRWGIEPLLEACRSYTRAGGERLTLEYVLLSGVNDTDADVRRLARLVDDLPARVNLIPFNPVPGWLPFHAPTKARVESIRDRLLGLGLRVSVRWSRGRDARAACGQLALLPDSPPAETA